MSTDLAETLRHSGHPGTRRLVGQVFGAILCLGILGSCAPADHLSVVGD